jgi:hypothetical protein
LENVFIINCVITYISLLRKHQRLVEGFLESAYDMLEVIGEIHVTHKTTEPYRKWDIERLAEDAGCAWLRKLGSRKLTIQDSTIKEDPGLELIRPFLLETAVPSNLPGFLEMEPKQALKPKFLPLFPACMAEKYRHSCC